MSRLQWFCSVWFNCIGVSAGSLIEIPVWTIQSFSSHLHNGNGNGDDDDDDGSDDDDAVI